MKKIFKKSFSIVLVAILVFAFNIVALAQGTTMIAVSKNSPAVGDSVTVSITASESGTVTVKYTSSMLTFSKCNVSGYSASGNSVSFSGKSGDITFSATSAGTASIIVSSTSCSGSSTTLAIGGGAASEESAPAEAATETTVVEEEPAVEEAPAAVEEPEESAPEVTSASGVVGTLNSNGGFDINGASYVVSERYSDSEMPSGFSKKTVKIGSSTYSEPVNDSITLLYLKPADNIGGSGEFYLYDAEAGTVSQFLMINGGGDLVIISSSESAPSSAFTQTSLDVTGGTATAYTIDGSEFYYVYGTNKAGVTGWFVYDSTYGTVSRVDESVLSAAAASGSSVESTESSENSYDSVDLYISKLNTYRKVIMGLAILCVILLFLVINTLIKSRGRDDDFDGDVFAEKPAKKSESRKRARSIIFNASSRKNQDEEEYDEDDYEEDDDYYDGEDYEEDESIVPDSLTASYESASNYDARRSSSLNMMDLNDL